MYEEGKVYRMVCDEKESTFRKLCAKAKNGIRQAGEWVNRNKEYVMIFGPLAIGGATAIVRQVGKHHNLRKEEDVKNLYCYDRSLGHYWALKRELSNREWVEIDQRKAKGERLADILEQLRVLK